jgi:hypothetical protein
LQHYGLLPADEIDLGLSFVHEADVFDADPLEEMAVAGLGEIVDAERGLYDPRAFVPLACPSRYAGHQHNRRSGADQDMLPHDAPPLDRELPAGTTPA